MQVTVTVKPTPHGGQLAYAAGMSTPHETFVARRDEGFSQISIIRDRNTGQQVVCAEVAPDTEAQIVYEFAARPGGKYPDVMFSPTPSRFTRAADALIADAKRIAAEAEDPTQAIAQHVSTLFSYDHPTKRPFDDQDQIPRLCSVKSGSCVDINAYFMASLRAAGIECGYMLGYFIPDEKKNWCEDSHCWVVTREDGETREWDIAHHLKMKVAKISPGLNPKPGFRLPIAHSMGLNLPELRLPELKLISQPLWVRDGALHELDATFTVTEAA